MQDRVCGTNPVVDNHHHLLGAVCVDRIVEDHYGVVSLSAIGRIDLWRYLDTKCSHSQQESVRRSHGHSIYGQNEPGPLTYTHPSKYPQQHPLSRKSFKRGVLRLKQSRPAHR